MKQLKDLVGQTIEITWRRKSLNQYKTFKVVSITTDGRFLELRGLEQDVRRKSEQTWYQNVAEIDTIIEAGPVETLVKPKASVKKDIPAALI